MGDFFTSKAECLAAVDESGNKRFDAETCDKAEDDAKAEFAKTAPKFSTREECEKEFGPEACTPAPQTKTAEVPATVPGSNTTPAPGGGTTTVVHEHRDSGGSNSFMPFMLGYMLGNAGGGGGRTVTPTYYGPGSYREGDRDRRPVYTSSGGTVVGSGGAPATPSRISTSGPIPSSVTANTPPSAPRPIGYVARGGFGSSGASTAAPPRSVLVAPSRSTGGMPTPSSISSSLKSSTAISSGFGRSSGSFGGSSIGSSSRGGFGGTGASFSAGS
jgi:uncharacterized protein YgiB involved in biofilm formation